MRTKTFVAHRPVQLVDARILRPASWRTTYIIKTDLEVLSRSISDYGWLVPLVVQSGTNTIIDGNYRWEIFSNLTALRNATKNMVPVIYVDCDDVEAMLMHARINRGRGTTLAKRVSRIIQRLLTSRKYGDADIKQFFSMHSDELDVMVDGTLLKDRSISDHKYSSAWVPIEAPSSAIDTAPIIERPPNNDQ